MSKENNMFISKIKDKARREGQKEELKEWINAWDEFSMKEFYEFIEDNRKRLKEGGGVIG